MEALRIVKGPSVFWKEHSGEVFNGRLFIVRVDSKKVIRRVWNVEGRTVLIPCAMHLDYEVEEYHNNEVDIIGVQITVKKML